MRFHVADSLTGKIVGRLEPSSWECTDPLRGAGTGSLTIPLPDDPLDVARLLDLTRRRIRWVALEDDQGRFLFGGPIPRRPGHSGGNLIVPWVDWRAWFYRAPIRPNADGTRRDYVKVGVAALEQATIMADLAKIALDTVGKPALVVDTPPTTGVTREITALMLDRSVGDYLDSIRDRERGCDWYTYTTKSATDPTVLVPHVAVAWPERRIRTVPIRVEYRHGDGGNSFDPAWPEGGDSPNRVWAVGDGEPPDQAWASDEFPDVAAGVDMAWEEIIGPLDGVVKKATAFEHALGAVERARGYEGVAEFSILHETIPLGEVSTGDRARIVYSDTWESVDVGAVRIIERTLSGGRDKPLAQRIKVDLADDGYPDDGSTPGEAVADDGT